MKANVLALTHAILRGRIMASHIIGPKPWKVIQKQVRHGTCYKPDLILPLRFTDLPQGLRVEVTLPL